MAICISEAIILNARPFRNTSLIITGFTKDFGKIKGIAKGIRARWNRKDSKFNSYLEPLTLNKIVYYRKQRSELHMITQCDLLKQFEFIRRDLTRLALANFILELTDKVIQPEDPNADVFELVLDSLGALCTEKNISQVLLLFEIKFLNLSGLMPQLETCVCCGRRDISGQVNFSFLNGGLICAGCRSKERLAVPFSKGALTLMRHIASNRWPQIKNFRFAGGIEKELKNPLDNFIKIHIDGEFKTLKFIEKIKTDVKSCRA